MAKHNTTVIKAVAITVPITLIIAAILFYLYYKLIISRRLEKPGPGSSFGREVEFRRQGGPAKGVVIDHDQQRLDHIVYLTRLQDAHFDRVWHNPIGNQHVKYMSSPSVSESVEEISLLDEPTTPSQYHEPSRLNNTLVPTRKSRNAPSPPPTPLHTLPSPAPPKQPPRPPPPPRRPPAPPQQTQPSVHLPKTENMKPAAPPPPVKMSPQYKPPIPPRTINRSSKTETSSVNGVKRKLKPLHWDKVTANTDYSMVWNEINDGSFRFDDELMESLFGYAPTGHKLTETSNKTSTQVHMNAVPSALIFLLDSRKSQNTAIVLKSLAISRKQILDALQEGRGLSTDTLEKLTKIRPTQDEVTKILQFDGNPTKLADAESFLYHILKAMPSAFIRLNIMLFRSTYDIEILHLKESLQTLELGCKELRSGRVFFKLLEAILKAGNRMNAGTARGNALGFNLSALRRLSDIKSTDGKTTLLYFVVEQVIHSEGKRQAHNQNHTECLMLGLEAVRSLREELLNVKKSATIDYDSFSSMCSSLAVKVEESNNLLTRCTEEAGGFLSEMRGFLEECQNELTVVRAEEIRVMDLVTKTTVYYQAGSSKDRSTNPLLLFVIVKDFLIMTEQVCSQIAKKLEKPKVTSAGSSPPLSPTAPTRMHNIELYFRAQRVTNSSSDSDTDF